MSNEMVENEISPSAKKFPLGGVVLRVGRRSLLTAHCGPEFLVSGWCHGIPLGGVRSGFPLVVRSCVRGLGCRSLGSRGGVGLVGTTL